LAPADATKLIGTLEKLGFTQGSTVETILVTVNLDGSLNAAPMGVRLKGKLLELRPYRTSATYANLRRGGTATINTTHDPMLFLATAFKDEVEDQPRVEPDMRLNGADSTIMVEVQREEAVQCERSLFIATPVKITVGRSYPSVLSRGRAQAVEAVIHATRVKAFSEQGRTEEAAALIRRIEECASTVRRISPSGSPEYAAVDKLNDIMRSWRVQA
jgi:hypothetical protein